MDGLKNSTLELDTDLVDRLSKLTNYQSHAYSFTYDGANRMLNATHGNNRYTEKVTEYDKNGNIKKLQRYGQTGASSYGLVDNLTYTYNGNQLTKVEDAVTATSYTGGTNFVNGSTAATEYTYDNNGNLTKDLNKGISSIQYNSLSLPSQVLFDNGATQTYHYTADGEKWRTVYTAGLLLKDTVDYCDGAIVENGVLKKLLTPVGYVDMSGTTPSYYYYLKDHQGNNRVVINANGGDAVEVNHYYPFGSLFSTSTNVQPYKYNGKELDTKKGLNWYDYGARHYDATLGRFTTQDRFAEKYSPLSPYQYGANSPVCNVDVNGDSIRVYVETNNFGHTWLSVGEGSDMIVYSYGRYNGTYKGQNGIESSNSVGNGDGVLLRMIGEDANLYMQNKEKDDYSTFIIADIKDSSMKKKLDAIFESSNKMPDNPQSDYYNNPVARIIDKYELLDNNCTTFVSDAINRVGSNVLKVNKTMQSSSFGTFTSYVKNERFVVPASLKRHLDNVVGNNNKD